ncbi:MAG TPA: hypothetical protein VFQ13_20525 [Anaerolineales bacterium]|nr:hypothetical protein [Anaerolineales bacterium]
MFSDYGRELLRSGIIDAKSGDKQSARRYLDRAVYISNDHEVLAEAWFWMSQVIEDRVEQRKALENCLVHDLHHARARRALAILDGKLKADEIVDPDHLPPIPEGLHTVDAERFVCPKCGGRMIFAPDGQSLHCEYCSRNQRFTAQPGTAEEKDFIIAMATARGHGKPLNQQVFHCEGCGCEFILPPNEISSTCAYCSSPHVVHWESEEGLLAPAGIIPHAFNQKRAIQHLIKWVELHEIKPEKQVELPRGVYLPLWTFDLGGEIDYAGEAVERIEPFQPHTGKPVRIRVNSSFPVQVDDIPIPASRKLSAVFLKLIPTFDLKAVMPYDPRYLANWPAEVYDIPMAEASLDARAQTVTRYKHELPNLIPLDVELLSISSAKMAVESFRLDLLPVWVTEIPFDGRMHLLLINGQNGTVASDLPEKSEKQGGLMDYLADLLDGRQNLD